MSEKPWFRLPREIRDTIYADILDGNKYVIGSGQARVRFPAPAYAGLLVASKEISAELQESLYKDCMFRAYFNRRSHYYMLPPFPKNFARVQRIEIFLDLYTTTTSYGFPGDLTECYRQWFGVFGGSGTHRKICRITLSNIIFETFFSLFFSRPGNVFSTVIYPQFLHACKTFVGFQIVVLELGASSQLYLNPLSEGESYPAATGPLQLPQYAGQEFEAFKKHLATELEPTLGPCIYYDRGNFRCLEFRPRSDEPIEPGCEPFIVEELDD